MNLRRISQLERRTDYELEKASLQDELEACYEEKDSLQLQLRSKCEEVEGLRALCADLENRLNQRHQAKVANNNNNGTCQFPNDRNPSAPKTTSWADRCKLEEVEHAPSKRWSLRHGDIGIARWVE